MNDAVPLMGAVHAAETTTSSTACKLRQLKTCTGGHAMLLPTCSVSWDCRDSTLILSTSTSAAEIPLSLSLAAAALAFEPFWASSRKRRCCRRCLSSTSCSRSSSFSACSCSSRSRSSKMYACELLSACLAHQFPHHSILLKQRITAVV